jgi:hypothetical protein
MMAYKIYTKLSENDTWTSVMDVKLSRTKKVDRIFMNEKEVKHFVATALKDTDEEFIKVEELDEA